MHFPVPPWLKASHTGRLPKQSESLRHSGTQVLVFWSHFVLMGLLAQSESCLQVTQRFLVVSQTCPLAQVGYAAEHCTQVLPNAPPVRHTGLRVLAQSLLFRHVLHVLDVVSHLGVGWAQSPSPPHATHFGTGPEVRQTGVGFSHPVPSARHGVQMLSGPHAPVGQSSETKQPTQVLPATASILQTWFGLVHAFVLEQGSHTFLSWRASERAREPRE